MGKSGGGKVKTLGIGQQDFVLAAQGVEQIRQLLNAHLQRHGIIPMDSLNKPFNPMEHEAIAYVLSDEPEGMVIDEVTRGYRMNEKVIRHAKVAVSKGNEDYQR